MKRINLLIILTLLLSIQSFAQTDKYTQKLSELYYAKEYEKVIKYKKGKKDSFESKSLFYKGLAHYMLNDDRAALEYFTLALEKGPADEYMYYYQALSLYYLKKYEKSIVAFDEAIAIDDDNHLFYVGKGYSLYKLDKTEEAIETFKLATEKDDYDPYTHFLMGILANEIKDYDQATHHFETGLPLYKEKSKKHKNCSYNLAVTQQLNKKHADCKETLENHIDMYPKDYQAVAKLVQTYYALGQIDESSAQKEILYSAYEKGKLPSELRTKYCFDQFYWNEQIVFGYESYEVNTSEALNWKYKFITQDENDEVTFQIFSVLDSSKSNDSTQIFNLCSVKNDTLYTFNQYQHNESPNYSFIKNAVLDILNDKVLADIKVGDYSDWAQKIEDSKTGSMGSSFESAIMAKSIPEEYEWLREHYPGHTFLMQSLVFHEGVPYDILKIKTEAGTTKDVYFNISSFFGKGY